MYLYKFDFFTLYCFHMSIKVSLRERVSAYINIGEIIPLEMSETEILPLFLDPEYTNGVFDSKGTLYLVSGGIYYQVVRNNLYMLSEPIYDDMFECYTGFRKAEIIAALTDDQSIALQNDIDSFHQNEAKYALLSDDSNILRFNKAEVLGASKMYDCNGCKGLDGEYVSKISSDSFRKSKRNQKILCFQKGEWCELYAEIDDDSNVRFGLDRMFSMDEFCEILDEFKLLSDLGLEGYFRHCDVYEYCGAKSARK